MQPEKKIRVLIVDDEPLGRKMVSQMLVAHPEIEILGECRNGLEAVEKIKSEKPDLIFLDVQMPNVNGFDVLERIADEKQPAVIFVTAYDEYALRAFEVNASGYLLKPYDQRRFDRAFERAMLQIRHENSDELNRRLCAFLSADKSSEQFIERFIIKLSGRILFLKAEEICWIEAEGNYVTLHTRQNKYLFREAISKLEQTLDPQKFQRIARSTIVHLDFIKELLPWFRGNYIAVLQDGTKLKLSRHYRENLNKYFAGSL